MSDAIKLLTPSDLPPTPREVAALLHIATGGTVRALGASLGLSATGAAMLLSRLYRKLDVVNGTHAVYRAVSLGLIPLEHSRVELICLVCNQSLEDRHPHTIAEFQAAIS